MPKQRSPEPRRSVGCRHTEAEYLRVDSAGDLPLCLSTLARDERRRHAGAGLRKEGVTALVHNQLLKRQGKQVMLRRLSIALLLATSAVSARVVVHIAPPPVIVATPPPPPGPAYVWTPGYYRWDGRAYVWVPGVWVVAPWPGARWIPPHWVHRHGVWVFVPGHWR